MEIIKTVLNVFAVIYIIGFLIFAFYSRKPLKFILFNAFFGLLALVLAAISGKFLGFSVFINIYSISVSGILGIPGVILLILVSIFL